MLTELREITVNDDKQWIHIRGKKENEVLLFLHGGPGLAQIPTTRRYLSKLEESFIVVDWDQRGSGKSRSSKPKKETFTVNQYIEDIKSVAEYLIKRFDKKKIHIVGYSWGTMIGILAAERYPHLFHSYIGVGQIVHMTEGENIAYDRVMTLAESANDRKTVKSLTKIGRPPYRSPIQFSTFRSSLDKYQSGFEYDKRMNIWKDYLKDLIHTKEYSWRDRINWVTGNLMLFPLLKPDFSKVNIRERVKKVEIPVYFVTGKNDYITPHCLIQDFSRDLEAPFKQDISFEKSGHNVHFENIDEFVKLCLDMKEKTSKTVKIPTG